MEITVNVTTDLKFKEAGNLIQEAARLAMRDTITGTANDSIKGSPVLTGNNRRSIMYEASGGGGTGNEGVVNQGGIEGAVYSTSGYGGFL